MNAYAVEDCFRRGPEPEHVAELRARFEKWVHGRGWGTIRNNLGIYEYPPVQLAWAAFYDVATGEA